MKRLIVREAFAGEPDPQQEGLAAIGEGDEALVMSVESGRLVVVVPPDSTVDGAFEAARFLALELTLEDGHTLSLGIEGDAEGIYLMAGRLRNGDRRERHSGGLSTV